MRNLICLPTWFALLITVTVLLSLSACEPADPSDAGGPGDDPVLLEDPGPPSAEERRDTVALTERITATCTVSGTTAAIPQRPPMAIGSVTRSFTIPNCPQQQVAACRKQAKQTARSQATLALDQMARTFYGAPLGTFTSSCQ